MNPMVPVLPTMTAIPGTRSHLHGPPVHPMSHFNMVARSNYLSIYLPIHLNPRGGHQTGSGEPIAVFFVFFFISLFLCNVSCVS